MEEAWLRSVRSSSRGIEIMDIKHYDGTGGQLPKRLVGSILSHRACVGACIRKRHHVCALRAACGECATAWEWHAFPTAVSLE